MVIKQENKYYNISNIIIKFTVMPQKVFEGILVYTNEYINTLHTVIIYKYKKRKLNQIIYMRMKMIKESLNISET